MRRDPATPGLLVLLLAFTGCSTFHLSEQSGVLPIQKQRQITKATLAVGEFTYRPEKDGDDSVQTADLDKWRNIVAEGLNQANIFDRVVMLSDDEELPPNAYILDGKIRSFRFQKNWVPTFFPLHLGLSFFTFTGYTLFGGPTTATIVRFATDFELKRAHSGELITSFERSYRSTRALNVYSKGIHSPYDNPNLVFGEILQSAAIQIAFALPDEAEPTAEASAASPPGDGPQATDAESYDLSAELRD